MKFAIQTSTSSIDIAAWLPTAGLPCAFMIRNVRPVLLDPPQRALKPVGLGLLDGDQLLAFPMCRRFRPPAARPWRSQPAALATARQGSDRGTGARHERRARPR